eukprot:snap_masked-scaffold_3-processed-gene-1.2-mRNA-1 protein AED:1.00 eAED:1.00 QI:0/-1/0/0/-1/1/1/0/126
MPNEENISDFAAEDNPRRIMNDYKAISLERNSFVHSGVIVSILKGLHHLAKLYSSETSTTISGRILLFRKPKKNLSKAKLLVDHFIGDSNGVENVQNMEKTLYTSWITLTLELIMSLAPTIPRMNK